VQDVQDHRVHDRQPQYGGGQVRHGASPGAEHEGPPDLEQDRPVDDRQPQTSDRFQKARANAANETGISKAMRTFQSVQSAVRYASSDASISITAGLGVSGAGNQNMLVASATRVSVMPNRLRL
jgi:hypothetical protein